jgi:hypothetical protein
MKNIFRFARDHKKFNAESAMYYRKMNIRQVRINYSNNRLTEAQMNVQRYLTKSIITAEIIRSIRRHF